MLLCLFFTVEFCSEKVSAEEKIVKVGYYKFGEFQSYDESGNPEGYLVDYLNTIAMITGWTFEYVPVENFAGGMEVLKQKEIDLLAPGVLTDERMQEYTFSYYPFGKEYSGLIALKNNDDFYYEDYAAFDGKRIAFLESEPSGESFEMYEKAHDFSMEKVYVRSAQEALEALKSGQADLAYLPVMSMPSDCKLVAKFSPHDFYFMTSIDNEALMDEVEDAMLNIENTYPRLISELQEKYFPVYNEQYLTRSEVEYISSLGRLRVGYVGGREPLSFTNEKTGQLDGISKQIFEKVEELTGLQFDYVEIPNMEITHAVLQEYGFQLVTGVEYNTLNLNARGVLVSTPYINSEKVFVGYGNLEFNTTESLKIAISTGSRTIKNVLQNKYPNMEFVDYENVEACFEAVHDKEVDALVQNQYVINDWLSRARYSDLKVFPAGGIEDKLCFSAITSVDGSKGMSEEDGMKLIQIINKAISQISKSELNSMIVKETSEHAYRYTMKDVLYSYRYGVVVLIFSLVVIGAITMYVVKLKRKNIRIRRMEERKIRLQQNRLRMFMEYSKDMIFDISLREETGVSSEVIKHNFGWSVPNRVEDMSLDVCMDVLHIHPDDREVFVNAIEDKKKQKDAKEAIVRIQHINGTYIWCKLTVLPMYNKKGMLISLIGKIEDIDEEIKEKDKLEHLLKTDGLTGLCNRINFVDNTERYLQEHTARRTGIIFIDLDHLKLINECMGQHIGDEVIMEAAKKIRGAFQNFDEVSRFGGDQFCVFVKDVSKEMLTDKLDSMVKILKTVCTDEKQRIEMTASIGASYCMKKEVTYEELLEVAERARYEAKNMGRDIFVIREIE